MPQKIRKEHICRADIYVCRWLYTHTLLCNLLIITVLQGIHRKGVEGYSGIVSFGRECDPKKFFAVIFGWFGVEMC